jgi:pSer/pThr/pTyr-binding forkhead associated (FHA) protein
MNLKLLVIQGKPAGKTLVFGPGEYYLGRGPECNIRFTSEWVSRQHCLLRVGADAVLRDLGSRNGTLVNGQLVNGEQRLAHGDQLQLGPVVFEVRLDEQQGEGAPVIPSGEMIRAGDQDATVREPSQASTSQQPALPGNPNQSPER